MFSRTTQGAGGDDHGTPQIIVLPPHSRFDPSGRGEGPLRPHPALQETVIEDVTPSGTIDGANRKDNRARSGPNSGRAMSPPAQPRQAFVSSPRNGRPNSGAPSAESAVRALNGTLVPTRSRPTSAMTNYRNNYYVPPSGGKRRPGSRPATASDSGGGRPDVYAMWTPGEAVLTGPSLTPLSATVGSHSARRPASEELQYELSVTASVLRAAQTRLTKEREQRQLARVGEELALVDAKRTKDEMKALAEERKSEAKALAKGMAEQRKELEHELQRLETEQEVRTCLPGPVRASACMRALSTACEEGDAFGRMPNYSLAAAPLSLSLSFPAHYIHSTSSPGAWHPPPRAPPTHPSSPPPATPHPASCPQTAVAGMQAELDVKDRALRDAEAKIARLTEQLNDAEERCANLEERLEQTLEAKSATEQRAKEERRIHAEQLRELKGTIDMLERARDAAIEAERRAASTQMVDASEAAKKAAQAELEAEREKRVQHLATVGIRRMFQAGIAKGWSAWHDLWEEKVRQQRLLKAAAARLSKPKVRRPAHVPMILVPRSLGLVSFRLEGLPSTRPVVHTYLFSRASSSHVLNAVARPSALHSWSRRSPTGGMTGSTSRHSS